MALIHMDSMDLYRDSADVGSVYVFQNVPAFSTTAGRFGGGAIRSGSNDTFEYYLPNVVTSGNRLWAAFAFYQESEVVSSENFLCFRSDLGDDVVQLVYTASPQQLELQDITNSTLATFTVARDVWHWIEMEAEYGSATGAIIVKLNGIEVYNGTGDTNDAGATGFGHIEFDSTFGATIRFDDIIIGDSTGTENTTFPGDTKIVALAPDGAGASTDFTANGAASNHEAADEQPIDGDTSYNSSGTSGDRDTFSFENLPETPDSIVGVQVVNASRKDDVGAIVVENVLTSGTTTVVGDALGVTTSYSLAGRDIYDTDPDTSSPWTETGVNGIEAGYQRA